MIPITAGILGGVGSRRRSRGRTPLLTAACTSLGLALVYASLGLLAGLTGTLFGTVSSNRGPCSSWATCCWCSGLALLDVFTVNAPARLAAWAGRFGGELARRRLPAGRHVGTGRGALRGPGVRRRADLREPPPAARC